jgi:hypothetical protein
MDWYTIGTWAFVAVFSLVGGACLTVLGQRVLR